MKVTKENWFEYALNYHEEVKPIGGEWEARYLALELGGEVGELLNIYKKLWRGHYDEERLRHSDLQEELADVYIVLSLIAHVEHLDLNALAAKKTEILYERLEQHGTDHLRSHRV